ncbi:MAG: peptidoglycan DD-metalloendopeptidase family protein [Bacteroidaceae bacterium]|nr:peptidoglycan DD-metalloendopeptidase family protein [Bacteroidaceae bacterium]
MINKKLIYTVLSIILLSFTSCFNKGQQQANSELTDTLQTVEPNIKWGINIDDYQVIDSVIGKNELLSTILYRHGVGGAAINEVEKKSLETYSVRKLRAGKPYHILKTKNDSIPVAEYFVYNINSIEYAVYKLTDSIYTYLGEIPTDTVTNTISGSIESSLWNAMIGSGADPELAGKLSDIYSWTIDFFGIQQKDSFYVYYQEIYADTSRVGIANVLASNFITGGKDHYAFYYTYRDERGEYFDENGVSLRRAFLKAPLQYSRISSKFSNARKHPITKVVRPHHGVDYAAPSGTPVHSVGDGTVIGKGWDSKGGGNYVRIKHNATYTTLYMHLKGFADGIKQGARVKQGQTIGYVGSTGSSTGPHLDYRVYKNGTAINPLSMDLPAVDPIAKEDMPTYLNSVKENMKKIGLEVPDVFVTNDTIASKN